MTDRSEFKSLLQRIYAARVSGDMDVLRKDFTDDTTYVVAGSPDVGAMTVAMSGHADVMGVFERMLANYKLSNFEFLDMLIDGDRAAVRWRATVHNAANGKTIDTELAHFITIENGKIASMIEFMDTALAARFVAPA
ncbi:MAG: nuclear transport factor 2 family protein [Hyphomicrobiales bacterium]